MKELEDTSADSRPVHTAPRETRELYVLTAGGQTFAVRAEEAEGLAEGLTPAPLPHAPASVLGVVSVRGRMRTLLYPPALFSQTDEREDATTAAPRFVVVLRGDEQLALAADSVEGVVTFNTDSPRFRTPPNRRPPPRSNTKAGASDSSTPRASSTPRCAAQSADARARKRPLS